MFTIRKAVATDAAFICQVHMASIRALVQTHYTGAQVEAWCGRRSSASYIAPICSKVVLVAIDGGTICGFAQLDPLHAAIEAIYVAPSAIRQGIGLSLLAQLETSARTLGITELSLDASLNAVSFYERAGYSAYEESDHELAPGVSIPCIVMRKDMNANADA